MDIITLLSKVDSNDLLQWRETLSHCANSISYEIKESADDFTREDLEFDLDSVISLQNFLQLLSKALED